MIPIVFSDTIKAGIAAAVKKFGGLHGVVNSAGIGSAQRVRLPIYTVYLASGGFHLSLTRCLGLLEGSRSSSAAL